MAILRKVWEWVEHGLALRDLLLLFFGFTTMRAVLLRFTQMPTIWVWPISILAALGSLWILPRFFKPKPSQQQTAKQTAALALAEARVDFDTDLFFRTAYYSQMTAEVEKNIHYLAIKQQPDDPAGLLAKFIGVGYTAYMHEMIWAHIYKSQVYMLMEMNRRNGYLPLADAQAFYEKAAAEFLYIYKNYKFESWLEFAKVR